MTPSPSPPRVNPPGAYSPPGSRRPSPRTTRTATTRIQYVKGHRRGNERQRRRDHIRTDSPLLPDRILRLLPSGIPHSNNTLLRLLHVLRSSAPVPSGQSTKEIHRTGVTYPLLYLPFGISQHSRASHQPLAGHSKGYTADQGSLHDGASVGIIPVVDLRNWGC